jgi:hypothetical protein
MKCKLFIASLAIVAPCAALADKLGDHPAVVVKRLSLTQGYDYAAKFYPHPAWLYLLREAPREPTEDPGLIASSRRQPDRPPPPLAPPPVAAAPPTEASVTQ